MVMYNNELETKKIKFEPRKKLNHNTYIVHYSARSKTLHTEKIILYHDKGLGATAKNINVTFYGKKVH